MRKYLIAGIAVVAVGFLEGGIVDAQVPPLPQVSPSERMVNEANRALRAQEQRQQQQNTLQFEINALRAQQLRQQQFPRLTGPNVEPHCQATSPHCR